MIRNTRARGAMVDRGAGTLLTFVLMPIALIGVAMLWVFVDLAMVRSKAAGAADLAALAGANYVLESTERACSVASEIAARNGAGLASCTVEGLDITVETQVAATGISARMAAWVGVELPAVRHRARAGFTGGL